MTRIVGIGGKLASGKDAISDHLVENYGWVKFGMSDALAEALYVLNPSVPAYGWTKQLGWFKRTVFNLLFGRSEINHAFYVPYQYLVDEVGYVEAKTNDEVRRLLQKLGTEIGREMISQNVWTDIMVRKVRKAVEGGAQGVIITGIRFQNELSVIMDKLAGETWWVDRPGQGETVNAGHASETSVSSDDFTLVIENDGTLDDLYKKVDSIVT